MFYFIFGYKLTKPLKTILKPDKIETINDSGTFYIHDSENEYLGLVLGRIFSKSEDLDVDLEIDYIYHRGLFRGGLAEIKWPDTEPIYAKDLNYMIVEIQDSEPLPLSKVNENYKEYTNLKKKAENADKS